VVLTASSITKTGSHDIAEILLKVVLDTINQIKSYHIKTVNGGVRVAQYLVFCAIFCSYIMATSFSDGRSRENHRPWASIW
jgi:hypothetical protein